MSLTKIIDHDVSICMYTGNKSVCVWKGGGGAGGLSRDWDQEANSWVHR